MSFAIGSSEPQLWFLIPSSEGSAANLRVMERRAARRGVPQREGAMHAAAEQKHKQQQQRRPPARGASGGQRSAPGYFTVELALAFLCVAASLAFLPLVLPPLSPPPFLLLLVPVGLLAVLVALAFVPLDAQSHLVGSSRL
ncbi:hypothetical protein ACP70R_038784 [Stipagrostis hirtigluma subsp. patula]